jgi:hypothetical protein
LANAEVASRCPACEDYGKLEGYVNRVIAEVQAYPVLTNVESDLDLNKP